jgi:hypothetical protein
MKTRAMLPRGADLLNTRGRARTLADLTAFFITARRLFNHGVRGERGVASV